MATVLTSSLFVLMPLIQQQLMSILGFDESRVILDTEKDAEEYDEKFQAEQVVILREESPTPTGAFKGIGRIWPTEDVRVVCCLWTRCALDNPPGFQSGLTDPNLGHEVWRLAVQNALYGFIPTDDNGNWLVQQPIQPAPGLAPKRRFRKRDDEERPWEWVRSEIVGTMTYAPSLDQTLN
jgi:hypothetical protein